MRVTVQFNESATRVSLRLLASMLGPEEARFALPTRRFS